MHWATAKITSLIHCQSTDFCGSATALTHSMCPVPLLSSCREIIRRSNGVQTEVKTDDVGDVVAEHESADPCTSLSLSSPSLLQIRRVPISYLFPPRQASEVYTCIVLLQWKIIISLVVLAILLIIFGTSPMFGWHPSWLVCTESIVLEGLLTDVGDRGTSCSANHRGA